MTFSSPQTSKPSGRPPVLTDPLRYPQSASAPMRSKRAIVLLLLTVFIPGSAQAIAGNRRLGRLALRVTFTVWLLIIAAILLAIFRRDLLISLFTNPVSSLLLIVALVLLAVGWVVMFVNTLRIIRPVMLAPGMRIFVSGALVVLMVICSGSLGYAAWLLNSGRNALGNIFASGPDLQPVDGRYNFLVMGGDAGEDREGRRPDSIIVVSVDAQSGQATTISIPRNFQNAPFPASSPMNQIYPEGYNCGDNCIINSLYTEVTQNYQNLYPGEKDPGAQAMMDATSGILGLTVQGYVLIDMAGFSQLIDALGGVKINAGGWVPISGAALDNYGTHLPPEGWIAPGVQTLDGYQALWYARSREYTTDYARSQRQQCIQQAILKQMDPATVLSKFQAIADTGSRVVESDIPVQQLASFIDLALKAKNSPLQRLTLGPPDFDRDFPTYPDFSVLQQRVQAVLNAAPQTSSPPEQTTDPGQPEPPSQPDQPGEPVQPEPPSTPDPTEPQITQEYLQRLAIAGDSATLTQLLSNNGNCSPG
ncbi:LCP family protein [Acaricomes phytoseiuli]|uniref:LCP family glycopolymer transferase n=1 Tax=Acaricomes phytoseiuli TaxID=291968 RepID=UPI00039DE5F7|nr:LCP family protein [Acaricomes phytoseiuli]